MIDQSHNLKGKMEEMIQTVMTSQELFAKAALVNHKLLAEAQAKADIVRAEECLRDAFATDVRPTIAAWRKSRGLPASSLDALRDSGYLDGITRERSEKNKAAISSYA